jgi:Zn-dependent peptidase ImmA (M78 family)/DNA-binding XRE family transcriptional regulator
MPKIVRADINPEILEWAREQAGLTVDEVARKLRVNADKIRAWETGDDLPTVRQLRLLGKAYKRPSAFFYLADPPRPEPEIPDYRRIDRAEGENPPELLYEIRRARSRREIALEVFKQIEDAPVRFDLQLDPQELPVNLGSRIREFTEISPETQFAWANPYEALKVWITALELKGILVFQFSGIDVQVARGFSLGDLPLPVIALNGKDAARGRIFTLHHELCHLAIEASGLCDLHEEQDRFGALEVLCNAVAAESLAPRELLLDQPEVRINRGDPEWLDGTLRTLSNRFMVSREVILLRLRTLDRTTDEFYAAKRAEFLDEYESLSDQGGGFLEYHKKFLRNNGSAYTSLLIDAYRENAITLMDVSRYLGGFRLNHLNKIENELG